MSSLSKLTRQLNLDSKVLKDCKAAAKFPFKTTAEFAARIQQGNSHDPILLQILPSASRAKNSKNFVNDPLQEKMVAPVSGLLHKYFGRVLLLVTDACAINCRYCFRQNCQTKIKDWAKVWRYIESDSTISEVILSGGDPLTLTDGRLKRIINKLAAIKHIKRLRIHTRMPIVLPQRITSQLVKILTNSRLPVIFVVQVNHAQEIDAAVIQAISRLRRANISVFNQSVVLKGVNDNLAALLNLSEKLFIAGIIPYYLHLLDKVKGAENFYVTPARIKVLMRELQAKLPGYLVPKLVYEKPGAKAKILVATISAKNGG